MISPERGLGRLPSSHLPLSLDRLTAGEREAGLGIMANFQGRQERRYSYLAGLNVATEKNVQPNGNLRELPQVV